MHSHARQEEMTSHGGSHDASDSLSHSSDGGTDFLGHMKQVHATHVLLPQLGSMPVFGSPTPVHEHEPPRKRKSVAEISTSDWGQNDDEDSMGEDSFVASRPHIAWSVNNHETWHRIFDPQMNEMFVDTY